MGIVDNTVKLTSSFKKKIFKSEVKQKEICLGKVCIRNKNVVEIFIGNNTIQGLILFNTGCVFIAVGIYNLIVSQFGKNPDIYLFFAVVFFILLIIFGILFKEFEK